MIITKNSILWKTRTYFCDFDFVVYPDNFIRNKDITLDIFKGCTPKTEETYLCGKIENLGKHNYYQATCFVDDKRKDEVQRNVLHFMVWLVNDEEKQHQIEMDWGKKLLHEMENELDKIFYNKSFTSIKLEREINIEGEKIVPHLKSDIIIPIPNDTEGPPKTSCFVKRILVYIIKFIHNTLAKLRLTITEFALKTLIFVKKSLKYCYKKLYRK